MPILSRYVLRQFINSLAICFLSLMGLYVVIDALTHLDAFVGDGESRGGLLATLAEYYGYQSLAFFDRSSSILVLMAAVFTATSLERHRELTAMLAAGISKLRVLAPILIAGIVVSLAAAAARETILPQLRDHLLRDTRDVDGTIPRELVPLVDHGSGIILGGSHSLAVERAILKPRFVLPPELGVLGELTAERAVYTPPRGDRPGGYLLSQVEQPADLLAQPSIEHNKKLIVLTPHDTRWLEADQLFVVSDVHFQRLASGPRWRHYASTPELVRYLASPSARLDAGLRTEIHSRFVRPLLDSTLLLLGLSLIVSRAGRNTFVAVGLCMLIVTAFLTVGAVCQFMGSSLWLSPSFAAWLPLIIFVPFATVLSDALRR